MLYLSFAVAKGEERSLIIKSNHYCVKTTKLRSRRSFPNTAPRYTPEKSYKERGDLYDVP